MKLTSALPIPLILTLAFSLTWSTTALYAQGGDTLTGKDAYYINLNQADEKVVQEIQHELLSLQYQDAFGKEKDLLLKIYNWKREEVARYSLAKTYGLNNFHINIGSFYGAWPEETIYTAEFTDESRHRYRLPLKKVAPPIMEEPVVSILVNPLHLECAELGANVVEFYGQIEGGKAPYQVNWYILNDQKNGFLYQPREEVIDKPGQTMVIQVDQNPNYYVLLNVKDACGSEQEQMVYLMCQEEEKKINSLFVEPIRKLPAQSEN